MLLHMTVEPTLLVNVMLIAFCIKAKVSSATVGDVMLTTVLLVTYDKALENELHSHVPNAQHSKELLPPMLSIVITMLWTG